MNNQPILKMRSLLGSLASIRLKTAALAGIAGLAFALLTGGDPTGVIRGSGSRSPPGSPSLSASSSPTSTSPAAVDPVESALDELFAVVDRGVLNDAISPKAAEDIEKRANDAYGTFREGDTEKAIEELEDLRDKVEEGVDHEEIANSYEQKLDKAIVALEEQMLRASPPEEE